MRLNKVLKNQVVIHDAEKDIWLYFNQPQAVLFTHKLEEIVKIFEQLEYGVERDGLYAAGFITYEAAPAFDTALSVCTALKLPLIWFGLYKKPQVVSLPQSRIKQALSRQWQASVCFKDYLSKIAMIKDYLAMGSTYQVNYTIKLLNGLNAEPWEFFLQLIQGGQDDYAAFIDLGDQVICSVSPELFLRLKGEYLFSRPMKGTVQRGKTIDDDRKLCEWLYNSEKNRAENMMIVDMIRNDMGKIAMRGSVEVTKLFETEIYPTVIQMTSTVQCRTKTTLFEIMAALFPCASITGAPKVRTMEIIKQIEAVPRGIYTGCIGYYTPQKKAQFSVAIRTVAIDRKAKAAEYGVGGGIVWDSKAEDEYKECLVKAFVLTQKNPDFALLETMLWQKEGGFFLIEKHLQRLWASARYFNIQIQLDKIYAKLLELQVTFTAKNYRIRLIVKKGGGFNIESAPLSALPFPDPVSLGLCPVPVDSTNKFLYHKTTNRKIYYEALAQRPDCFDVLLWNEKHEITESCYANVVYEFDNQLFTPPVKSGLLSGTYRQYLLEKQKIAERVLKLEELKRVEKMFLVNSVRKRINIDYKG